MGEPWHTGAMKENKYKCRDDIIAAANYLIANKYSDPNKLVSHLITVISLLLFYWYKQMPMMWAFKLFVVLSASWMYKYLQYIIDL